MNSSRIADVQMYSDWLQQLALERGQRTKYFWRERNAIETRMLAKR